ncbi:hypothetical protein HZ326_25425 [Fusarium oxysporum f. sp. albedinis]|nr:hypothetical protein HZ326_25425 [Fusarium oxysporum f. sp. albedinis]
MTEELGRSVTMLGILSSGTRNQMMHGRVSTSEFGDFPFEIPLPCSRYSMLTIAMQTARLYLTCQGGKAARLVPFSPRLGRAETFPKIANY